MSLEKKKKKKKKARRAQESKGSSKAFYLFIYLSMYLLFTAVEAQKRVLVLMFLDIIFVPALLFLINCAHNVISLLYR